MGPTGSTTPSRLLPLASSRSAAHPSGYPRPSQNHVTARSRASAAAHPADLARRARIDVAQPINAATDSTGTSTTPFELTDRELAVLRLLGDGLTNNQIGATLFISPKTASVHVTNILRKLGVNTRAHAATIAARHGLLN